MAKTLSERVAAEAHPRDLSDEQLEDIELVQVTALEESRLTLPLNGRLVLAMTREIRRHRTNKQRKD